LALAASPLPLGEVGAQRPDRICRCNPTSPCGRGDAEHQARRKFENHIEG
jgi:hypothetical protein